MMSGDGVMMLLLIMTMIMVIMIRRIKMMAMTNDDHVDDENEG